MRLKSLFAIATLLLTMFACGGSTNDDSSVAEEAETKPAKVEKKELTVEAYAKIVNEERALLMEKYWDQLKGKSYEEGKDIYLKYDEELDEIFSKYASEYDLEKKLDLSDFFRKNFKEVGEFQATDPDYKEYPEYADAKNTIISYAMKTVGQ